MIGTVPPMRTISGSTPYTARSDCAGRPERKVIGADVRRRACRGRRVETDRRVPGGTCAPRWRVTSATTSSRILVGHQPAGDLGVGLGRDHGLLPRPLVAAPHAVDLERRPRPLALERGVAGLAECGGRADLLRDTRPRRTGSAAMAARSPARQLDAPGRRIRRRPRGRRRRCSDATSCAIACSGFATPPPCRPECRSLAAPVSVNSSPASPRLATVSDGSSMRHIAPSAEMHDVGGEQLLVVANERVEAGAADLLLALEHELDVDRQRAGHGEERFGHLDRDQHRSLVVRHAARVEAAVAHRGRERRTYATSRAGPAAARRSGRTRARSACRARRATRRTRRDCRRVAMVRTVNGPAAASLAATHRAAAACPRRARDRCSRSGSTANSTSSREDRDRGSRARWASTRSVWSSLAAVDREHLAGDPDGLVRGVGHDRYDASPHAPVSSARVSSTATCQSASISSSGR